jgi:putative folate metabolism gamma-glutamate ligase
LSYRGHSLDKESELRVRSIRTHRITDDRDLLALLDRYVASLSERSVLAITSKVVSICQGRLVPIESADKQALVEQEADRYLPPGTSRYGVSLTLKDHLLIPSSGVDASNSNGYYVLWPEDAQDVANRVRAHLCRRFGLRHAGVILTDSKSAPLRWGATGVAIAHSGFLALNDLRGQPDLFGQPLEVTTVNVADALAVAAVLVMGESDEGTPLAVIEELPFVTFQTSDPTPEELQWRRIRLEDDLYAPLLQGVDWQQGGGTNH